MSIACNHCEAPVCEEACPVAAITKDPDDGRVLINPDICVGCKLCQCCPYDAPQFNEQLGIMQMCDGCVDLEGTGEQQACVAARSEERRVGKGCVSTVRTRCSPYT